MEQWDRYPRLATAGWLAERRRLVFVTGTGVMSWLAGCGGGGGGMRDDDDEVEVRL